MVHTIKKLKKFDITPYGFDRTWTIEGEDEADAVKQFIDFQKHYFKWSKPEWQNFLEVAMAEADIREIG